MDETNLIFESETETIGDFAGEAAETTEAPMAEDAPVEDFTGEGPESLDGYTQVQGEDAPKFTVKHLGQEYALTQEELLIHAQKGMDYDRIREDRDAVRSSLELLEQHAGHRGMSLEEYSRHLGELRQEQELQSYQALLTEYPEVRGEGGRLPDQVVQAIQAGETPLSAYRGYMVDVLRQQLTAQEQNRRNAAKNPGPVGATFTEEADDFLSGFYGQLQGG